MSQSRLTQYLPSRKRGVQSTTVKDQAINQSIDQSSTKPTQSSLKQSKSLDHSINQSIKHDSIRAPPSKRRRGILQYFTVTSPASDQSISQSINQTNSQSISPSTNRSIDQDVIKSSDQSINQSLDQSLATSVDLPASDNNDSDSINQLKDGDSTSQSIHDRDSINHATSDSHSVKQLIEDDVKVSNDPMGVQSINQSVNQYSDLVNQSNTQHSLTNQTINPHSSLSINQPSHLSNKYGDLYSNQLSHLSNNRSISQPISQPTSQSINQLGLQSNQSTNQSINKRSSEPGSPTHALLVTPTKSVKSRSSIRLVAQTPPRYGQSINQPNTQLTSQTNNQSIDQSNNQSVNRSFIEPRNRHSGFRNRLFAQSTDEPINESFSQSSNESINQSNNEPINQSINQSANQSVSPSVKSSEPRTPYINQSYLNQSLPPAPATPFTDRSAMLAEHRRQIAREKLIDFTSKSINQYEDADMRRERQRWIEQADTGLPRRDSPAKRGLQDQLNRLDE